MPQVVPFVLLPLRIVITFKGKEKFNFQLRSFLQSPFASSVLRPNNIHTGFSNTLKFELVIQNLKETHNLPLYK